jgi:starch-binding outer membrane protein, SusD/RagB family
MTTRFEKLMAVALMASAVAGCEVTNPGPVADEDLNRPAVHQSVVNGSGRELTRAIGNIGYVGGVAARELMPGGNSNDGFTPPVQAGYIQSADVGDHWNQAHSARWIAEDAIRRFKKLPAGSVDANTLAQGYIWAGYANRLLGENFCTAIFDGGAAQANSKYFERAEEHFTNALATATNGTLKTTAYAGRASVRVWLKNWAGAVSDANQVPFTFVNAVDADGSIPAVRNYIYFVGANIPYRGYSVWKTWHADYYTQTGDPRVRWITVPNVPFSSGQIAGYGAIPYWWQRKYVTENDDYRLSTGREMALIKAEAALTGGDMATAMTLINSLRVGVVSDKTGQPVAPWVAGSINDAWTFLKRERNIEMWMEARRLGDIRRWAENKTPGTLDWPDYEAIAPVFKQYTPVQCYPVPDQELNTNPNLIK